jgi:dTDP-4-amino-4,6-dideoxygalactose transaminase
MPTTESANRARISFVEEKYPDWRLVEKLLQSSARANRWANFGPVQDRLADVVARMLDLGSDRTVVTASSATSALHALTGAYAHNAGRPLKWAISAYGFFSTAVGPLANHVEVVDCDSSGMLDISALAALPAERWDGLLVTDIFGAQPDFSAFASLCAAARKPMIIDSAVSFPTRRSPSLRASEIVSFHHTKPWGFGEGGCAIVQAEQTAQTRSFLNFGVDADKSFASFAGNGKMSDVAAALILQRIEGMELWAGGYRQQRQRIKNLALSEGLDLVVDPAPDIVAPHVPVLSPRPIALAALANAPFAVAKYYRPLDENCRVATDLYSRIVNVPCHPGMTAIDDLTLRRFFRGLVGKRRASKAQAGA